LNHAPEKSSFQEYNATAEEAAPHALAGRWSRDITLLQGVESGSEVNMKRMPIKHEGWYGLHPGSLGLGDAALLLSQMHDLNVVARGVKRIRDVLLRFNAYRATCVVKHCLLAHGAPPCKCGCDDGRILISSNSAVVRHAFSDDENRSHVYLFREQKV